MKGLLLKDFFVVRESLFTLLLILIAIGAGLAFLISPCVLIVIAATTLSMQAITTIQNDKSTKWNRFSATLPVSRAQAVKSKYLIYLFLCITGIVSGIAVSLIASLFQQNRNGSEMVIYICIALVVSLLSGSVSVPCALILDEEKSIMGTVLSYIVTAGLFGGLIFLLRQFLDLRQNILTICGIAAGFSLLVFSLSWLLCPKWIAEKDM